MNILLFGAPGAGKGTQSELLVKEQDFRHISTGDLFREAVRNETELGIEAKKYMEGGKLVPDNVTIGLIEEVFNGLGDKGFILDGFPRTVAQAEALDKLLDSHQMKLDYAAFIDVPQELLMRRLTGRRVCPDCGAVYHIDSKMPKAEGVCDSCGKSNIIQRKDDTPEVIGTRLEAYESSTAPLKDYYEKAGNLVKVDGAGTANEVFGRLTVALK